MSEHFGNLKITYIQQVHGLWFSSRPAAFLNLASREGLPSLFCFFETSSLGGVTRSRRDHDSSAFGLFSEPWIRLLWLRQSIWPPSASLWICTLRLATYIDERAY